MEVASRHLPGALLPVFFLENLCIPDTDDHNLNLHSLKTLKFLTQHHTLA